MDCHVTPARGGTRDLMVACVLRYNDHRAYAQNREDGTSDLVRTKTAARHEGLVSDEEEEWRHGLGSNGESMCTR